MAAIHTILKGTVVVAGITLLASCTNLPNLRQKSFEPSDFDRELAREYKEFADSEAQQYDWIDSDYFAKKGLKALRGGNPKPEIPSQWRQPADKLPELVQARQLLLQELSPENKANKPVKLARVQKFYDCWVEQQEENWQPGHIAACRQKFLDAMAALDKRPAPFTVIKHETVYFEFDRSFVDGEAEQKLDAVSNLVNSKGSYRVNIGGHTDRSGPVSYNNALAKRRVNAVKDKLILRDVPSGKITTDAFSENRPKLETADGVKERTNRRVELYVIE